MGSYVSARRLRLGLSTAGAARKAGISRGTWINLESGTRETLPHLYAAIERTLQWAEGSIEDILAGGEPTVIEGSQQLGEPDIDTEDWLRAYAANPRNSAPLREWAESLLDQLARIRTAHEAEEKERGDLAS